MTDFTELYCSVRVFNFDPDLSWNQVSRELAELFKDSKLQPNIKVFINKDTGIGQAFINFSRHLDAKHFYETVQPLELGGLPASVEPVFRTKKKSYDWKTETIEKRRTLQGEKSDAPGTSKDRRENDDTIRDKRVRDGPENDKKERLDRRRNQDSEERHSRRDRENIEVRETSGKKRKNIEDMRSRRVRDGSEEEDKRGRLDHRRNPDSDKQLDLKQRNPSNTKYDLCKKTRTIYIGGVTNEMTQADIGKVFKRFGIVVSIVMRNYMGCAFLKYFNLDMANRAFENRKTISVCCKTLKVGFARKYATKCVWVGGIGTLTDEKLLLDKFSKYGTIDRFLWPKNKNFAYVLYECPISATSAMQNLNGRLVSAQGPRLALDFVTPADMVSKLNFQNWGNLEEVNLKDARQERSKSGPTETAPRLSEENLDCTSETINSEELHSAMESLCEDMCERLDEAGLIDAVCIEPEGNSFEDKVASLSAEEHLWGGSPARSLDPNIFENIDGSDLDEMNRDSLRSSEPTRGVKSGRGSRGRRGRGFRGIWESGRGGGNKRKLGRKSVSLLDDLSREDRSSRESSEKVMRGQNVFRRSRSASQSSTDCTNNWRSSLDLIRRYGDHDERFPTGMDHELRSGSIELEGHFVNMEHDIHSRSLEYERRSRSSEHEHRSIECEHHYGNIEHEFHSRSVEHERRSRSIEHALVGEWHHQSSDREPEVREESRRSASRDPQYREESHSSRSRDISPRDEWQQSRSQEPEMREGARRSKSNEPEEREGWCHSRSRESREEFRSLEREAGECKTRWHRSGSRDFGHRDRLPRSRSKEAGRRESWRRSRSRDFSGRKNREAASRDKFRHSRRNENSSRGQFHLSRGRDGDSRSHLRYSRDRGFNSNREPHMRRSSRESGHKSRESGHKSRESGHRSRSPVVRDGRRGHDGSNDRTIWSKSRNSQSQGSEDNRRHTSLRRSPDVNRSRSRESTRDGWGVHSERREGYELERTSVESNTDQLISSTTSQNDDRWFDSSEAAAIPPNPHLPMGPAMPMPPMGPQPVLIHTSTGLTHFPPPMFGFPPPFGFLPHAPPFPPGMPPITNMSLLPPPMGFFPNISAGVPELVNAVTAPIPSTSQMTERKSFKENQTILSSKKFPIVWSGALLLKSKAFVSNLYLISGSIPVVNSLLTDESEPECPVLDIVQRLRVTDSERLAELEDHISRAGHNGYSVLLTSPADVKISDDADGEVQQCALASLGTYLRNKECAAVIFLPPGEKNSNKGTGVMHVFPRCTFATELLKKEASELCEDFPSDDHLLVLIVRDT